MLRTRITRHRSKFYDCMREAEGKEIELSDEHVLGLHLFYEHGLKHVGDFNEGYKFSILEVANPREISKRKHIWIDRYRCIIQGVKQHVRL